MGTNEGKIGTVREPADEHVRISQAQANPYHRRAPINDAERAALGVLAELLDRRVIGDTLEQIDIITRRDIVQKAALIIQRVFIR